MTKSKVAICASSLLGVYFLLFVFSLFYLLPVQRAVP